MVDDNGNGDDLKAVEQSLPCGLTDIDDQMRESIRKIKTTQKTHRNGTQQIDEDSVNTRASPDIRADAYPPGYQLPSAGPVFNPPMRPVEAFLREVRKDRMAPLRRRGARPRALRNPGSLCYRNAVLTALLNSDRFLGFLAAHACRIRTHLACEAVDGHLLTRLYQLAIAYWARGGVHPWSADGRDTCERMTALLWRAICKDDINAEADDDAGTHDSGYPMVTQSWKTQCGHGGSGSDVRRSLTMCHEQQDAAEFFEWLVEKAATQLRMTPTCYSDAHSADYYDGMFRAYLTSRFACINCHRAVRLRKPDVEREASIKLPVGGDSGNTATAVDDATGHCRTRRVQSCDRPIQTLDALLARFFDEDIEGMRCVRCGQTADRLRRLRRMQTTPEILTVHLLRATYIADGEGTVKHHDAVDVPELLDVSPWLEPHIFAQGTRIQYRLASIVSHRGAVPHTGHYVSFVRSAKRHAAPLNPTSGPASSPASSPTSDSGWTRIDDWHVQPGISLARIINTTSDPRHRPGTDDWFDPTLLVYEKWVERHIVDRCTGQRIYQVPMDVPGGHVGCSPNTDADADTAARAEAAMTGDVLPPETWPPRHVIGVPPHTYQPGRSDPPAKDVPPPVTLLDNNHCAGNSTVHRAQVTNGHEVSFDCPSGSSVAREKRVAEDSTVDRTDAVQEAVRHAVQPGKRRRLWEVLGHMMR